MESITTQVFSEKDLFRLFSDVDTHLLSKNKCPTFKKEFYFEKINEFLPTEHHLSTHKETENKTIFVSALQKYKRKKQLKVSRADIIDAASTTCILSFIDEAGDGPPQPKKSRGSETFTATFASSYKDFNDLSENRQRVVTKPLIDMLNQFIDQGDYSLSVNQLLGYLLCRENRNEKSTFAYTCGQRLLREEDLENAVSISPMEGVSFMHSLNLSKEDMRCVRRFMHSKNVWFPTTNELLEARKSLRPVTVPVLEGKGRGVDYVDLVKQTASSIISVVCLEDGDFVPNNLKLYLKDGGDGAGSMPKLKSVKCVSDKENIFQYGIIPLKLTVKDENGDETTKWENKVMNAASCFRSVYTIREKEDNEELLDLVIKSTDKARSELNSNGIEISINNETVHVECDIKDTMKDMKFKKKISGLGGADCLLCKTKQTDWTSPTSEEDDFKINRSAVDTRTIFQSVLDEDGNIIIKPHDFSDRSGVTRAPITESDQHSIAITHSYINGCHWFLKLLYRCYADRKVR